MPPKKKNELNLSGGEKFTALKNTLLKRERAFSFNTQYRIEQSLISTRKSVGVTRPHFYDIVKQKMNKHSGPSGKLKILTSGTSSGTKSFVG